jgi:ERO1-like protein alpha
LVAINRNTFETLQSLVKTKFFRIIRINIENECPFWAREKMCKSGSCTVCRCDEKDIPQEWSKTDLIEFKHSKNVEQWSAERNITLD